MRVTTAREIINHTTNTYAKLAAGFDETRKAIDWSVLSRWAEGVPAGSQIADVGCGSGRLLRYLKDKQLHYIGIDPVRELLDRAKVNAESFALGTAEFVKGELLNVSLTDQSQDAVFCVAALHHVPSSELRLQAVRELSRILKPNGKLYLTVWNLWQTKYRWLVADTFFRKVGLKQCVKKWDKDLEWNDVWIPWRVSKTNETLYRYYHAFTKHELQGLIEAAGFVIDKIGVDGSDEMYSGKGWNWIVEARRVS